MLKIIKDAQLLLNTHRVFQGVMDFYQDSIQEEVQILSTPCEGEDPMIPNFREVLERYFKKSFALHQKVALLWKQVSRGSKESRKQLKSMGHCIGLRIDLKDYFEVIKHQSKLYKDLGRIFVEMNGLLFGMLAYCSQKEQLEIPQSIHRLTETLHAGMAFIENVSHFLKLMEDRCAHPLQVAGSDVVQATDLFNSVAVQHTYLQGQRETGTAP